MLKALIYYHPKLIEDRKKIKKDVFTLIKEKCNSKKFLSIKNNNLSTEVIYKDNIEIDKFEKMLHSALELNENEIGGVNISIIKIKSVEEENEEARNNFSDDIKSLEELKKILDSSIEGQANAIEKITEGLLELYSDGFRKKGPIMFTFMGPHSAGKTRTCQVICDFYNKEFDIEYLFLDRADYEDDEIVKKITDFVDNNKYCFLVFNDIEEQYKNISNFLVEVLISSRFKDVDFSNVVFFFTTSFGSSLYNNSLNSNLSLSSDEDLSRALLTEKSETANIGTIDERVAKILAKSNLIMFDFVEPSLIRNNLIKNVESLFEDFKEETGIEIECNLEYLITLLFYQNYEDYDRKTMMNLSLNFLKKEIKDIFLQTIPNKDETVLTEIKKIKINFDTKNSSKETINLFNNTNLKALLISDKKTNLEISKAKYKNVTFDFVSNLNDAKKHLEKKYDFIILDVLFDYKLGKNSPINIEDYNNGGVELFKLISNYYNYKYLYILSKASDKRNFGCADNFLDCL